MACLAGVGGGVGSRSARPMRPFGRPAPVAFGSVSGSAGASGKFRAVFCFGRDERKRSARFLPWPVMSGRGVAAARGGCGQRGSGAGRRRRKAVKPFSGLPRIDHKTTPNPHATTCHDALAPGRGDRSGRCAAAPGTGHRGGRPGPADNVAASLRGGAGMAGRTATAQPASRTGRPPGCRAGACRRAWRPSTRRSSRTA